jgi:hypothetical protein
MFCLFSDLHFPHSLSFPDHIKVVEGLNAIPLSDVEKMDCNKTLTPQQIKKIEMGKF